eukprot:CCRYP_003208-RA/>CCRYP_003208-RA protein AED:0.61 eAED:0.32 QI:0/0/0/0.5/1/1/2/0/507
MGECDHDAATTFIAGIHRVLRETYNPETRQRDVQTLRRRQRNRRLKRPPSPAAKSVLDGAKAAAAARVHRQLHRASRHRQPRPAPQGEADRINLINQAVTGAKEGAAEAITAKVGSGVTGAVLKTAGGSDLRSIGDWLLEEVLAAVVQGADRPNSSDVLAQLLHVIQFEFDFRKKVSANMELLRAKAGRMTAYGITVDDSQLRPRTPCKHRHCKQSRLGPTLPQYAADPSHTSTIPSTHQFSLSPKLPQPTPIPSNFKHKAQRKALERQARRLRLLNEATLLDHHISWAEDERTTKAKADTTSTQRRAIDTAHTMHPRKHQQISHGQALATTIRRTLNILSTTRHVRFAAHPQIRHFDSKATTPLITFDSGADSHYLSETDRLAAGLPILRSSTRRVGVANGSTSTATYVSQLPFPQLSPNAVLADSFADFPQSLMSVGKTCDDRTVAISTQSGITVHKDTDMLITCQGEPLLIGARDAHGRYRIPLTQHKGRWQPWCPSKKARQTL